MERKYKKYHTWEAIEGTLGNKHQADHFCLCFLIDEIYLNKSVNHHEGGYQQNAWPEFIHYRKYKNNEKTMDLNRRGAGPTKQWRVTQERTTWSSDGPHVGLHDCVCVCGVCVCFFPCVLPTALFLAPVRPESNICPEWRITSGQL